jgi:hypothetical protein
MRGNVALLLVCVSIAGVVAQTQRNPLEGDGESHLTEARPAPSDEEQTRTLERARETALQYTATLPNFLCTETVRRYTAKKGSANWEVRDTLGLDLAYSGKKEDYKLVTVDGKPTNKTLQQVGGFTSNGEFATLLEWIFRAKSETVFHWERWCLLRGRPAQVFSYRIEKDHSKYSLNFNGPLFKHYRLTAAFGGLVYLDGDTGQVVRITHAPDGIPGDWPVVGTPAALDYGTAEIGGEKYLLPARAETLVLLRDGSRRRNMTEFGNYRKFSSETTLTFEKPHEKQ